MLRLLFLVSWLMVEVGSRSLFCVSVVSYGVYAGCSSVLLRYSLINFVTSVLYVRVYLHFH